MTSPPNSSGAPSAEPISEHTAAGFDIGLQVPRWHYELFRRWFNEDTSTSRQIAAEAARQAGERR